MQLSCPSCGAQYELPETLFLAGPRKVRCVKCAHAWMAGGAETQAAHPPPQPDARPAATAPDAGTEPEATARRPSPLRRRAPPAEAPVPAPDLPLVPVVTARPRTGSGAVVAWAASLLLLAGAGWAGWEYRADVKAAWPASARLYAALGD